MEKKSQDFEKIENLDEIYRKILLDIESNELKEVTLLLDLDGVIIDTGKEIKNTATMFVLNMMQDLNIFKHSKNMLKYLSTMYVSEETLDVLKKLKEKIKNVYIVTDRVKGSSFFYPFVSKKE